MSRCLTWWVIIGSAVGRASFFPARTSWRSGSHAILLTEARNLMCLSYLSLSFLPVGAASLVRINRQPHTHTHTQTHMLIINILMNVNLLYNTGNLIAELRAPVNNRGNDEIIICGFSGEDGYSLQQEHTQAALQQLSLTAICRCQEWPIDGSRGALPPTHNEVWELLYLNIWSFLECTSNKWSLVSHWIHVLDAYIRHVYDLTQHMHYIM